MLGCRIGDVHGRDAAIRNNVSAVLRFAGFSAKQPFFAQQHVGMNLVRDVSEAMIRNDDHRGAVGCSTSLQGVQDLLHAIVQKGHRRETGSAHRPVLVVDVIQAEQVKQQQVGCVFFQNQLRGVRPHPVLPRLAAVFERPQLIRSDGARSDNFALDRAVRIGYLRELPRYGLGVIDRHPIHLRGDEAGLVSEVVGGRSVNHLLLITKHPHFRQGTAAGMG